MSETYSLVSENRGDEILENPAKNRPILGVLVVIDGYIVNGGKGVKTAF